MAIMGATKRLVRDIVEQSGLHPQAEARLEADAKTYWTATSTDDEKWRNDSHFRDGSVFDRQADWRAIGTGHLAMFDRLVRMIDDPARRLVDQGRVIEWGCGGGANAVAFAPRAESFVGVDITQSTLDECSTQVESVTEVPFTPVLIDPERPELAVQRIGASSCDLFLTFYVLELVPSRDYGIRLMRIARELLTDNGLAFIQVKYSTGHWRTKARRRGYRASTVGSMTTYGIHEFWEAMVAIGLQPELVHLVPENDLDSRYAYYLLRKI